MGARNRDAAVAVSWQQHHCSLSAPRRSAGTAAAARSCGVAAATATMRAAVVTMFPVFRAAVVTMPLAGNSTIAYCSRRDEALVPPLLPALVALLLPPQRCALPLWRCSRSSALPL